MANQFGERIKELRKAKRLLLKDVSSTLSVDIPMLSKIENGERKAKKAHLGLLASLFNVEEEELLTLWLADQVYEVVKDEGIAVKVLNKVTNILL